MFLAASVIGAKVLERIVGQAGLGGGVHHQGRVHGREQRVAVRRGLRHLHGADRGVGAGAVLDHDRLAPVSRSASAPRCG